MPPASHPVDQPAVLRAPPRNESLNARRHRPGGSPAGVSAAEVDSAGSSAVLTGEGGCAAGDGANRWPAVHRLDAAHLFRLAVEQAPAGSVLHAIADEGVPIRAIAEVIGRHLDLPVAAILSGPGRRLRKDGGTAAGRSRTVAGEPAGARYGPGGHEG